MMKKLLLFCVAVFACNVLAQAQTHNKTYDTNNPTGSINDTLRYFEYKYIYKNPPTHAPTVHPYYKAKAAVVTNTFITHVGSIFKNKDNQLLVYGLETRLYRPNLVESTTNDGGVPFRLYLCNVVNNVPVFPPIDSVFGGINNAGSDKPCPIGCDSFPYRRTGKYFGATFADGPKLVTGDFAVLGRCVSTRSGDTVNFFHTGGYAPTATNAPTPARKFGEGLGVVRKGGVFQSTRNFVDPSFGVGTDYEFCFAPMVTFTLNVDQIESTTLEGACQWEVFTNTNSSSPEYTNRQFNFDQFYRQLRNFDANSPVATTFTPDSVLAWDVGDGQAPFYLPVGLDSLHMQYGAGICNRFFPGTETGTYKQSAYNVNAVPIVSIKNFTGSCVWCNDTAGSGIREMGPLARLKIFPNPTVDKTIISGLEGANTIYIYNMMGQIISSETYNEEVVALDFAKQPQGAYLVRINNMFNNRRLVKIIKQ